MAKSDYSEEESESESESEEEEEPTNKKGKINEYELQRLKRIEENQKRMEALGLPKMATTFMGSVQKVHKKVAHKKGKQKMTDEDEEYNPVEEEEEEEEDDEEKVSESQKKKVKKSTPTPKRKGPAKKLAFDSDYVDDDDSLMQAIALSLGFLDAKSTSPSQSSGPCVEKAEHTHITDTKCENTKESLGPSVEKAQHTLIKNPSCDNTKRNLRVSDESGKRKSKKQISGRVQMSEDDMLIHFFEFDETGKGGLTVRDIERLAIAHDFIWSEKEIADMLYCFDTDGDGKISFDDFRKIVVRCNMLKDSDNNTTGG